MRDTADREVSQHETGTETPIATRAVRGSFYSIAASAVTLSLGFLRAVLLARLLLPEHFGVVALALFYVNLVSRLRSLGLSSAMIHREEVDEQATETYLTISLVLLAGGLLMLLGLAPLLSRFYPTMPTLGGVLIALAAVNALAGLNAYPMTFLNRALAFRRLALADVTASVAMTALAPLAALAGWGPWSLVVEQAVGQVARAIVSWTSPLVPAPRLGWAQSVARWLWTFGSRAWLGANLTFLIDRLDDLWIGTFLGKTPLGYYSRAYEFARYPRRVIANPLTSVFFPTFARFQRDRLRLSQAFYRVTSLMVRLGLWFGVTFALVAPEFIQLMLGKRWLPMLTTFQLMLLYTFADPLTVVTGNLLMATGHPDWVAQARVVQLAVFAPTVVGLGLWQGIEGVALAADLMAVTGAVLLFAQTRRLVDYSLSAMWLWPTIALAVTGTATLGLSQLWHSLPMWGGLLAKGMFISGVYGGVLWLAEREQLKTGWNLVREALRPRKGGV